MNTQHQIGFISGKIQQLQTAILHSQSNCVLKLPTCLAKTLQVDEVGCVWVSINKPMQVVHEFDQSFHVELDYYKKGAPFFLKISGMARLVTDPDEINLLPASLKKEYQQNNLLLCIRILQADYHENQPKLQNVFQNWLQSVALIFSRNNSDHHFNIQGEKSYALQ